MSDSQEYLLRWRGRQSGPYPVSEINRMLDDHEIGMGHEILYQDEWITVEQFLAALQKAAAPAPTAPRPVSHTTAPAPPPREKSSPLRIKVSVTKPGEAGKGTAQARPKEGPPRYRLGFALLAVFAGFTGAHNFYARHWLTGLLQLLLSVATILMHFGIVVPWVWAIAEAVLVRKDGYGEDMI
jgi:TM2 domain-containing membrane protein YozV